MVLFFANDIHNNDNDNDNDNDNIRMYYVLYINNQLKPI